MKLIDAMAADYWIANTETIYADNFHISGPVMDAYKAGFEACKKLLFDREFSKARWVEISAIDLNELGEEEC